MGTSKEVKDLTLKGWVEEFGSLYQNKNEERSIHEMWLAVVRASSCIAEGIRKSEYLEVKKGVAHTFSWLCTFYACCKENKPSYSLLCTNEELCNLIAFKYPGICGRCYLNHCQCDIKTTSVEFQLEHNLHEHQFDEDRKTFIKNSASNYTLEDWGKMFVSIYINTIYKTSLESIGFHLMEETGEVAKVIKDLTDLERKFRAEGNVSFDSGCNEYKEKLKEEIADTFSFLTSVAAKLSLLITGVQPIESNEKVNFGDPSLYEKRLMERIDSAKLYLLKAVLDEYMDPHDPTKIRCPDCKHNKCDCHITISKV